MKRRNFLLYSAIAGISLPLTGALSSCSSAPEHSAEYKQLITNLLKDWCDGIIKRQIINPADRTVHGQLDCPACEHVHGRIMDAVYPLFYLAKSTGDKKYLDAGIAIFEWGENVSREDGAWTNDLNPKSWDGVTVFGAISLAETLQYHGDLVDEERRERWTERLKAAAAFVYQRFPRISSANINYGATTVYALNLFGRMLNNADYLVRSKELATQVKTYFTEENTFLLGELQGDRKRLSEKGLPGIDMGYNVEESLNTLVAYALEENDEELLQLVEKSLNTHLEFMLPDGGLDNSFGTRMFKWTYWGSRTSDGMQQAFGMMAHRNPALGTAAYKNAELLKQCTSDGLLHGGPHYVSHGIKPCIHHTFSHVKLLATMLEHWEELPEINNTTVLPRELADGVKYYQEIDSALFARGDWRGTVSAYDAEYDFKVDCRQATGGALSLLYHNRLGLLCAASMAVYRMKEPNNMQPAPGKDIALTPRLETFVDETWYTNLFDLGATFNSDDDGEVIEITANAQLKNEDRELVAGTASDFILQYACSKEEIQIIASTNQLIEHETAFVLPIISPGNEEVTQPASDLIRIIKPEGTVFISANVPLKIMETEGGRTFNMVPGVEAIPIAAVFPPDLDEVILQITIS